jgi:acetyltransferase
MIEPLPRAATAADIDALAALLCDGVEGGASVGFLPPLSRGAAARWWRDILLGADPRALVLVARDADRAIVGSVQLHPAAAPNQPHRAEVAKLLVHRRARRRGLGRALMEEVEAQAAGAGFSLLTLDTKRGDAAEGLYLRLGWSCVGVIPGYAIDGAGVPRDTVLFYKRLHLGLDGGLAVGSRRAPLD